MNEQVQTLVNRTEELRHLCVAGEIPLNEQLLC